MLNTEVYNLLTSHIKDNDWGFHVNPKTNFVDLRNPGATPITLSGASKLLANNATWEFQKTKKPHHSLVKEINECQYPAYSYSWSLNSDRIDCIEFCLSCRRWDSSSIYVS